MKRTVTILIIIILVLAISIVLICIASDKDTYENVIRPQYNMEINLDTDNMIAKITQEVSYCNNTDTTLEYIVFNLYPYVYSEESENLPIEDTHITNTYYNGINYGGIIILRVEDIDKRLDYDIRGQLLYVYIDNLEPNDNADIKIRYHVLLPEINHRFGYNQHTINLANFYPQVAVFEDGSFRQDKYYSIGDPFYSDMADYIVSIRIPINYTIATSATLQREELNVSTKTQYYQGNKIRDFAIVISDEFSVAKQKIHNIDVYYYYYKDSSPEDSLNTAVEALLLFNDIIGEYPYDVFSIVETEFVFGGMEYSQLIMISSSVQGYDRDRVIVHETAHQWWYNIVGNNSIDSAWMDEGLTEFTSILYYIEKGQDLVTDNIIYSSTEAYVKFNENKLILEDYKSNKMNRPLDMFITEYEYITMVYCKGLLLFDSIYEIIGHDKFIKALRIYYDEYKFSIAKEQDLINAFCKADARGLEGVFRAWLEGYVVILSPYS